METCETPRHTRNTWRKPGYFVSKQSRTLACGPIRDVIPFLILSWIIVRIERSNERRHKQSRPPRVRSLAPLSNLVCLEPNHEYEECPAAHGLLSLWTQEQWTSTWVKTVKQHCSPTPMLEFHSFRVHDTLTTVLRYVHWTAMFH